MARYGFLLVCLLASGCKWNANGDEFDLNYISCEKPANADKWQLANMDTSGRFSTVNTLRFRISFDTQRVVSNVLFTHHDCVVYDADNFSCDDVHVSDGESSPMCSIIIGQQCMVYVGPFARLLITTVGPGVANNFCKSASTTLDYSVKSEQERFRQQQQQQ